MEKELAEQLAEISKHIQSVGRMIGSKKMTLEKLTLLHECLKTGADTLAIYAKLVEKDPTLL
jgi:hypothetical protein